MSIYIIVDLIILSANIAYAFLKKKNNWLLVISLILIFVFMVGNNTAPDYLSYYNDYNQMMMQGYSNFSDIGFNFLERAFVNFGFNYCVFRGAIMLCSYTLIYKGLKYFNINIHYIISLFLLYQLFMDSMQIRNFLACSIFVYSIHFLTENDYKGKIKYSFLILIAGSIHSSLLLYIVFIFKEFFIRHKNIFKLIIASSLLMSLVVFIFPNTTEIFYIILNFFGKGEAATRYFSQASKSLGFILPLLSFILYSFAFLIFNKRSYKERNNLEFGKSFYVYNLISMLFLPLVIIDPTWYRIMRGLNIITYSHLWLMYDSIEDKRWKVMFFIGSYMLVFLWFFIECINWIGADIIYSMLIKNIFY